MTKFTLKLYRKRPSRNRSSQNEIDWCVLWPKYLAGASELLVTVFSTDDDVTDFWFFNFRLLISERRANIRLQMDSFGMSTAVIYGLILQQVFPYVESYTVISIWALFVYSTPIWLMIKMCHLSCVSFTKPYLFFFLTVHNLFFIERYVKFIHDWFRNKLFRIAAG